MTATQRRRHGRCHRRRRRRRHTAVRLYGNDTTAGSGVDTSNIAANHRRLPNSILVPLLMLSCFWENCEHEKLLKKKIVRQFFYIKF